MGSSLSSGQGPPQESNDIENIIEEEVEEQNNIELEHKYNEFKNYINNESNEQTNSHEEETREERIERKRKEMEEFYNEVINKREQRNKAISDITRKMKRMNKLEEELEKEKEEKQTLELHCNALKQVNKITKEMLKIRETQVQDLKNRLKDIEKKLLESPEEIKIEYEKQMMNYKKLRELYEQRAVAAEMEHKTMIEKELAKNALLEAKLKDIQDEIQAQLEKYQENKLRIAEMEKNINLKNEEIETLNENLTSSIAENHNLNSQMALINNLFSNMIVNPCMNLDMLIKLIQDNYLLIIDLINNHEINDTVSLLVDIEKKINQQHRLELENGSDTPCTSRVSEETDRFLADETEKTDDDHGHESGSDAGEMEEHLETTQNNDKTHIQEEIANNLPKVWRILIELLNTHQEKYENTNQNENFESCYKNIKLQNGKTHQVISVSQTFIRLKHLILEKNHLNTQLMKLKTLNNHLEIRLNESEKRLNTVTNELKKTWSVVNKLKLQHKQLYTHEKILKYELKHKRNMINDLKIDLEYVREKWDMVKEKNEQNEMDYKILRKEFALRRLQYDGGRSSESGISTDTEDDNVEVNETIDESDDDKSEVVETQSEHDVIHTNSMISVEEDEEGEIEELDNDSSIESMYVTANETNDHSLATVEVNSVQVISNYNEQDIQSSETFDNERVIPNVEGNTATIPTEQNITEPDLSELNERFNAKVNEVAPETSTTSHISEIISKPSNPFKSEENNSDDNNTHIIGQNKVTIKSITGKIKVITEPIPQSSEATVKKGKNNDESESDKTAIKEKSSPINNSPLTEPSRESSENTESMLQNNDTQSSGQTKQLKRQSCIGDENINLELGTSLTTGIPLNEEGKSYETEFMESKSTVHTESIETFPEQRINSQTSFTDLELHTNFENNSIELSNNIISESNDESLSNIILAQSSNTNVNVSPDQSIDSNSPSRENLIPCESSSNDISNEMKKQSDETSKGIKGSFSDVQTRSDNPDSMTNSLNDEKSTKVMMNLSSMNSFESTPSGSSVSQSGRTQEEILEARNARLKRLEDQTKNLFHKMSLTSQRSDTLSERLEELHDYYGASNDRNSPSRRGDRNSPTSERNSPQSGRNSERNSPTSERNSGTKEVKEVSI